MIMGGHAFISSKQSVSLGKETKKVRTAIAESDPHKNSNYDLHVLEPSLSVVTPMSKVHTNQNEETLQAVSQTGVPVSPMIHQKELSTAGLELQNEIDLAAKLSKKT